MLSRVFQALKNAPGFYWKRENPSTDKSATVSDTFHLEVSDIEDGLTKNATSVSRKNNSVFIGQLKEEAKEVSIKREKEDLPTFLVHNAPGSASTCIPRKRALDETAKVSVKLEQEGSCGANSNEDNYPYQTVALEPVNLLDASFRSMSLMIESDNDQERSAPFQNHHDHAISPLNRQHQYYQSRQKYCCPYSGCTFTMVQQPILYHHVRTCHDANLPPLSNPVFQSSIPEASSSAPLGHLQHQASTVNTMQQNNGTSPRLQTQLPSVTCILQSHQQQQQAPSPPPPRRPRVVAAEPFNLPPQPIPAISTEECRSVLYPPSEKHPHQMIVPTQHRSYPQTCKFPLPEEYQQTSSLQPSQHLRAIAPAPYNPSLQGNWLTSLGGHQSRLHPPPQKRLRVIAPPQLCRFPLAEEHQQVSFSQPPQHPRANAPAQHLSPLQSNQFASVKKGQQTFDPPSQNGPCVVGRAPYDIPLTQSNSSAPTRQQPRAIAPAPYSLPSRPNSFTLAGLPRKRTRRPNQKLLYTNR